jgi:hypothetical protein
MVHMHAWMGRKYIIPCNVKCTSMVITINRLEGYLKLNDADSRPKLKKRMALGSDWGRSLMNHHLF